MGELFLNIIIFVVGNVLGSQCLVNLQAAQHFSFDRMQPI